MALALGRTVEELDATMSASEFLHWMAYYNLEPFGAWRDNWHAAQLLSMTANINRDPKRKAFTTDDFMFVDPETERISHIRVMMDRFNARAVRDGKQ